jgi:hypothetical protein
VFLAARTRAIVNFRFSNHAKQEIERRGIALTLVESILNAPQQIIAEKAGRKAYQSKVDFGGKTFLLRIISS